MEMKATELSYGQYLNASGTLDEAGADKMRRELHAQIERDLPPTVRDAVKERLERLIDALLGKTSSAATGIGMLISALGNVSEILGTLPEGLELLARSLATPKHVFACGGMQARLHVVMALLETVTEELQSLRTCSCISGDEHDDTDDRNN